MPRINMFGSMDVSASALSAQRARLNAIAKNIANAGTTKTETGEPYRRQEVVIESVPEAPGTYASPVPSPIVTGREREATLGAGSAADKAITAGETAAVDAATDTPIITTPSDETGVSSEVPGGVRVAGIREDDAEFPEIYDPAHPDANAEGFVKMPNVNMINEMVDMMMAARAYEANLAAMNSSRDLLMKTLTIGKQ